MASRPDIKNRGGRPATGQGTPVLVRLHPDQLAKLDAWIKTNDASLTRPAAIRAVLEKLL
ncbi:hypothetical protein CQ035_12840 [Brevundimonas sp. MYb46]|nr:hypothetical protein CQ026_11945 [Brevundimonas sp. MYb31]PRA36655.1 hypothetical protein CQ024_00665 [Brevundimonas sp. MYb27]PRB12994.1 hypothetical protein CQ039_13680 [Brevundimonas sp. MYb52]PRB33648.1 hypothetical protein CQ035_12840 [Brevundimonas sp. MYb46]PRB48903.1 hypothetical protein CQ028_08960 [Brevundimonas sp. MYb33]